MLTVAILAIGLTPLAICLLAISSPFIQSIWSRVRDRGKSPGDATRSSTGFIASILSGTRGRGEAPDDPICSSRLSGLKHEVWTRIVDVRDEGPPEILRFPIDHGPRGVPGEDGRTAGSPRRWRASG